MSLSSLRWHRHLLWALCVTYPTTLLAQAAVPEAAAAPEDLEKRKEEAKVRFQRGLELVQNESWDAALAEFLASRKLFPTRVALKNAALSLRQLKRYVEALAMYNELLTSFGSSIPPEERKTIDDAVTQLKQTVGEIQVNSDQPGSSVVIDGQQQPGVTPLSAIAVNAGTHTIRISKEGYENFEASVLVAGAQRETVNGKLKALSTVGHLLVREAGGKALDVVVDGAVVGKTPRYEGVVSVGPHTVLLRGEGNWGTAPAAAVVKENQIAKLTLSAVELDAEVRIEPVPANASVFVDGVQLGNGVWEGRLQSGAHQIEIADDGFVAYRKTTTLSKGQKETVKVKLERDLSSPMWSEGFRPHLYGEVFGGATFAPAGFGGDAEKDKQSGSPLGFVAGGRLGFQFIKGLSGELAGGFLYLEETAERKVSANAEHDVVLNSTDYEDRTRFAAPYAELSVAYQMLDKTPLTLRLGGGVAFAKGTFKNEGTFSGDICEGNVDSCKDTVPYSHRVSIPEEARRMVVPFVAPEVRIGYRLAKKVWVDLGVGLFVMLPPKELRKGQPTGDAFHNINLTESDRKAVLADAPYAGTISLNREQAFGVVLAIVPTISGHYDFW